MCCGRCLGSIARRLRSKGYVLPDGPTARGAATSWRMYRSWWGELHWSSRWSGDDDSDHREDRCCLVRQDKLKRRANDRPPRGRPVRQDMASKKRNLYPTQCVCPTATTNRRNCVAYRRFREDCPAEIDCMPLGFCSTTAGNWARTTAPCCPFGDSTCSSGCCLVQRRPLSPMQEPTAACFRILSAATPTEPTTSSTRTSRVGAAIRSSLHQRRQTSSSSCS
jgi:hypothetical protein